MKKVFSDGWPLMVLALIIVAQVALVLVGHE